MLILQTDTEPLFEFVQNCSTRLVWTFKVVYIHLHIANHCSSLGLTNMTLLTDYTAYSLVLQGEKADLSNYNYTTLPYRYITRYLQQ